MQENSTIATIPNTISAVIDESNFQNNPLTTGLTQKQRTVLYAMLANINQADDQLSDGVIAEKAGVSENTVLDCRHNPKFNAIYTTLLKEITKSHTGLLINRLFQQSKTSTKAAEILLKYTDQLITKTQNINANLNYSSTKPQSQLQNLIDMLKSAGYTKERLMQEIDELWNQ